MSLRNKKILKDYKIEYAAGEDGRQKATVTYTGDYYVSALPQKRQAQLKRAVLTLLLSAFCVSLAVLIPDARSSFQVYIVLPQVFALASLAGAAYYSAPLFYKAAGRLRYKQMLYVTHRSKYAAAASAVMSAASVIGRTVFLCIFFSPETAAAELALFACTLASAAICTTLLIFIKKITYIKEQS